METQRVIELRDCTIYITEYDQPFTSNGRMGAAIAVHAKQGGEFNVSQTGDPMSGHATAIALNVYAPTSEE